jgi:hypothetical protein
MEYPEKPITEVLGEWLSFQVMHETTLINNSITQMVIQTHTSWARMKLEKTDI